MLNPMIVPMDIAATSADASRPCFLITLWVIWPDDHAEPLITLTQSLN